MEYKIYKNLEWLNELPQDEAESVLLECCGSRAWARRMAEHRPFPMLHDLYTSASVVWFALTPADWIEAFGALASVADAGNSKGGVEADKGIPHKLAEKVRLYEEKFGFTFIIFSDGRSIEEVVTICDARSRNSGRTELLIAAHEQEKITESKLNKLLER